MSKNPLTDDEVHFIRFEAQACSSLGVNPVRNLDDTFKRILINRAIKKITDKDVAKLLDASEEYYKKKRLKS